jgi:hypothetical protein
MMKPGFFEDQRETNHARRTSDKLPGGYRVAIIPEPTILVLAMLAGGVMLASPEFHVR